MYKTYNDKREGRAEEGVIHITPIDMAVSRLLLVKRLPHTQLFSNLFLMENCSKIAHIGRNWMKLGRNPIELVVLEPLGSVAGPNLDRHGPKKQK